MHPKMRRPFALLLVFVVFCISDVFGEEENPMPTVRWQRTFHKNEIPSEGLFLSFNPLGKSGFWQATVVFEDKNVTYPRVYAKTWCGFDGDTTYNSLYDYPIKNSYCGSRMFSLLLLDENLDPSFNHSAPNEDAPAPWDNATFTIFEFVNYKTVSPGLYNNSAFNYPTLMRFSTAYRGGSGFPTQGMDQSQFNSPYQVTPDESTYDGLDGSDWWIQVPPNSVLSGVPAPTLYLNGIGDTQVLVSTKRNSATGNQGYWGVCVHAKISDPGLVPTWVHNYTSNVPPIQKNVGDKYCISFYIGIGQAVSVSFQTKPTIAVLSVGVDYPVTCSKAGDMVLHAKFLKANGETWITWDYNNPIVKAAKVPEGYQTFYETEMVAYALHKADMEIYFVCKAAGDFTIVFDAYDYFMDGDFNTTSGAYSVSFPAGVKNVIASFQVTKDSTFGVASSYPALLFRNTTTSSARGFIVNTPEADKYGGYRAILVRTGDFLLLSFKYGSPLQETVVENGVIPVRETAHFRQNGFDVPSVWKDFVVGIFDFGSTYSCQLLQTTGLNSQLYPVGNTPSPYIKFTPDKQYWILCGTGEAFMTILQCRDCNTQLVGGHCATHLITPDDGINTRLYPEDPFTIYVWKDTHALHINLESPVNGTVVAYLSRNGYDSLTQAFDGAHRYDFLWGDDPTFVLLARNSSYIDMSYTLVYDGTYCESDNDCSSNSACRNSLCKCKEGYEGDDCHLAQPPSSSTSTTRSKSTSSSTPSSTISTNLPSTTSPTTTQPPVTTTEPITTLPPTSTSNPTTQAPTTSSDPSSTTVSSENPTTSPSSTTSLTTNSPVTSTTSTSASSTSELTSTSTSSTTSTSGSTKDSTSTSTTSADSTTTSLDSEEPSKPTSSASSDSVQLELVIEGTLRDFNSSAFEEAISKILNISSSSVHVIGVSTSSSSKRQSSVKVEFTIDYDKESGKSASESLDVLVRLVKDNNPVLSDVGLKPLGEIVVISSTSSQSSSTSQITNGLVNAGDKLFCSFTVFLLAFLMV